MIAPIEMAIEIAELRGLPIKEDWYALLNFAYFQNEEYAKLRDTLKTMLANWPRKRYWMTLAAAYSELGDERNLTNAYAIAHTQDFLESESEVVTMAQLYLQRDVPYLAAQLLQTAIDTGGVSKNEKNYRLLSQAWSLAREEERSIPALQQAARLSDDGELDVRLGNAFLAQGRYNDCVAAVRHGLEKGGLKSPDHAWISLGMCLYNEREYAASIKAFAAARKTPRSTRTADEWIRIIGIYMRRDAEIEYAEGEAQRQLKSLTERRAPTQYGAG
jgi:tetratricopeptide (TPR) repeat protein